MSTAAIRSLALSLILTSLAGLLALGGCGTTGTRVCTLSGCCGPTSDACVVPQFLYANGLNGQITIFPIVNGTGIPGTPTSVSGPANSLGMAALSSSVPLCFQSFGASGDSIFDRRLGDRSWNRSADATSRKPFFSRTAEFRRRAGHEQHRASSLCRRCGQN